MGYIGTDPELMAITTCTELLESLTVEQRLRVMAMLGSRFGSQQENSEMRTRPVVSTVKHDNLRLSNGSDEIESSQNCSVATDSEDYPTFYSVYSNEVTQSESEVLLVMAFYVSNFGANNFTKEDLLQYYKDQEIYTESRRANSSNNVNSLVRSKCLEAVAKGNYRITKNGKQKAIEIIGREECPKPSSSKQSGGKNKKAVNSSTAKVGKNNTIAFLPDLVLYPDNEISLEDFYNQFITANNYENNLIFVYYLVEKLKLDRIGLSEIFTCYKTLGLEIPNIGQSIADTARRKTWIIASDRSNIKLHRNGENYINKKMKRKEVAANS
jgi:hypothetical protein